MTKDEMKGIAEKVSAIGRRDVWHKRWRNLAILLILVFLYQSFSSSGETVSNAHIAVINIDEEISQDSLFWDQFERIDPQNTKGLLILMNSPGGTIGDSERLYNTIARLNATMPTTVLVENYATSGGYLGAIGCDRIFAYNSAIIGSIGIVIQNYVLDGLFEKVGIKVETMKTGEHKGHDSYEDMPDNVRGDLQELLDDDHEWFLNLVRNRRNLSRAQVRMISESQIYNARRALEIGLIDGISTREAQLELLWDEVGYLPVFDLTVTEDDVFGLAQILGSQKKSLSKLGHLIKKGLNQIV